MAGRTITGGVFAPIVSPFDADERLDIGAFRAIVEYLAAGGLTGLLVAGTTGEAYTLDMDERRRLFEAAVRQSDGRLQILAGAGAITTRQAAEFTALAADCGCDAACVLTPWFQQATPDGLASYFGELAERARLPLLFYHNPPRTGLNWAVEHIAKLANTFAGPFVGIKESTHNAERVGALRGQVRAEFLIYSGNAHQQPAFRAAGSSGTIDPLANALPTEAVKSAGGDEAAMKLYGAVAGALAKSPNLIATLKQLMRALGLPAGVARRPHHQVAPAAFEQVRSLVSKGGRMAAGAADAVSAGPAAPAGPASVPPAVHLVEAGAIGRCLAGPAVPADTVVLYRAVEGEYQYNHHPSLACLGGQCFAAWSSGRFNEDSPGQVVRFATSADNGRTWSAPRLATEPLAGVNRWTNGGLWVRAGRLYLLATRYTRARYVEGELTPGRCWEDLATEAFVWESGGWQPAGLALDDFYSNEAPRPLPGESGLWLWPGVNAAHEPVLAVGGRAGVSDWRATVVARRSEGPKLTEPSWYATGGGRELRVLFRDDGGSRRLWVVDSADGGATWGRPQPSDLPDAQSKFVAVPLPGSPAGRVALVCSPTSPPADETGQDLKRKLLAIALSDDGRVFGRVVKLRCDEHAAARLGGMHKAPGFQYPSAMASAGRLLVIYSVNKEDIELSSVDLAALR